MAIMHSIECYEDYKSFLSGFGFTNPNSGQLDYLFLAVVGVPSYKIFN